MFLKLFQRHWVSVNKLGHSPFPVSLQWWVETVPRSLWAERLGSGILDSSVHLFSGLSFGSTYAKCLVSARAKWTKHVLSSRIWEPHWENSLLSSDDSVKAIMPTTECPGSPDTVWWWLPLEQRWLNQEELSRQRHLWSQSPGSRCLLLFEFKSGPGYHGCNFALEACDSRYGPWVCSSISPWEFVKQRRQDHFEFYFCLPS